MVSGVKKKLKKFKTEDEEREFWARHDLTDYFECSGFQPTLFPELKPSVKTISIRLPESLLESLKVIAHKRDVPYQSLMKMFITEAVIREFNSTSS